MKVLLARSAGFCQGVRRAFEIALDAARDGPVFTLGPLINNPQALERLADRGVDALPAGRDPVADRPVRPVVIRAHGLPRDRVDALRGAGLPVLDATCPHVLSNQRTLRRAVDSGRFVYLAADPGHPETEGLLGQTGPGTVALAASPSEAESVEIRSPALLLAQTTFGRSAFGEIARILRRRLSERGGDLDIRERSICFATDERQAEAEALAARADALVVVGGRDSANTRRLAEIGRRAGKPTFHVETADELRPADFANCRTTAVTAGASTPHWITRTVVERLEGLGAGSMRRLGMSLMGWSARWRLSVAIGVWGLTAALIALAGGERGRVELLSMAALYAWSAHLANRRRGGEPESRRAGLLRWGCSALGGVLALALARDESIGRMGLSSRSAEALGLLMLFSWLYAGWTRHRREEPAADKDLYAAFGVTVAAGIAAALSADAAAGRASRAWALAAAAVYAFAFIFAKSVLLDLRDIAGDHLVGDRTWPVRIGRRRARRLVSWLFVSLAAAPPLCAWAGVWPAGAWPLSAAGLGGLGLLARIERVRADRNARWLADSLLAAPGVIAWLCMD